MRHTPSAVQAQNELIRHRAEGRIQHAATIPLMEALAWVGSNLGGLNRDEVAHSEADNGRNVITRGKKKSLARKLAEAFINPFTAILFFLGHHFGNDRHGVSGAVDDEQHAGGF